MAGGYQRHHEEFGDCFDPAHSGVEMMEFEVRDERTGRWRTKKVPACAECFGLK